MDFQEFKKKFSEQLINNEEIQLEENTVFRQLLSWDSLTAMAVIAVIEDDYSVKITDQEFKSCNTIGEIYALVKLKQ